jgi:hypothetical protein
MIDDDACGAVAGIRIGRGNRSTRRKRATLSTTNPTCPDLGLNPSSRGGKPATNSLSYGTACVQCNSVSYSQVSIAQCKSDYFSDVTVPIIAFEELNAAFSSWTLTVIVL